MVCNGHPNDLQQALRVLYQVGQSPKALHHYCRSLKSTDVIDMYFLKNAYVSVYIYVYIYIYICVYIYICANV